ncbi:unnamed protein product [Ilex paraguariensis]|uniref:Amino acid transporter transmembrane domain-containing protein n=1 Tax=Ilex paraguariensis TaxID=185542 RepID=A0ABC8T495_9AQUA
MFFNAGLAPMFSLMYPNLCINSNFWYLMFGPKVQSQITLNLPTHKISSRVAIYATLINPISKYPLMVTPILNTVENPLRSYSNTRPLRFVISTILVISTIIVALTIPFFGYLVSLVGALLSVALSTLFPCL